MQSMDNQQHEPRHPVLTAAANRWKAAGASHHLRGHPSHQLHRQASLDGTPETWWCNTHQRKATFVTETGKHKCDPQLGGITMPCVVISLTNLEVEID